MPRVDKDVGSMAAKDIGEKIAVAIVTPPCPDIAV